jgi:glutamate--cysteine ligase
VSLDAAWDLAKDWSAAERQQLRDDVPRLGLAAEIRGRSVADLAAEVLKLSRAGLARRDRRDASGRDESRYLDLLDQRLARRKTPAEDLLDKYRGPWNGAVDPIYVEQAY